MYDPQQNRHMENPHPKLGHQQMMIMQKLLGCIDALVAVPSLKGAQPYLVECLLGLERCIKNQYRSNLIL